MVPIKLGVGLFGAAGLAWVLFTSLAIAMFFSRRISRKLSAQGKPLDRRTVAAAFSSEYTRSDIYGAIVSWIGCVATLIALGFLVIHKLFFR